MTQTHTGEERVGKLDPVTHRDWRLWVDWCTATDRDPHHAPGEELAAFITDLPATTAIHDRRLRNIRRALGQPVVGLPRPTTRAPARVGPEWLTYPDALTALRHEWFPEGVAARRDALILTLTAHGFTRTRIRHLQPPHVETFPEFAIDGLVLTRHRDPALCAQCALVRWLAVLDAYRHRSSRDIEELLTHARTFVRPKHDCLGDIDDGWQTSPWLIPSIDKHGALTPNGRPVTGRALTSILTRRLNPGPSQPIWEMPAETPTREQGRRPTRSEQDEIAELYDRVNAHAEALNARIEALLRRLT